MVSEYIVNLRKQLKRKEQECEKWKEIIDEAKNSKLDLKSFLVGEAIQNEYEQQLDQLKAENDGLKIQIKKHNDDMFKNPPEKRFYCKGCTLPYISKKQSQTLTEIKEIAERGFKHSQCNCGAKADLDLILQKISECEVNDE
jgi:cell division protein FtsB